MRAGLGQGVGVLAVAASSDPATARLRAALPAALASVDALVSSGQTRLTDWEAAHAAAIGQRAGDLGALDSWTQAVQDDLELSEDLVDGLASFRDQVESSSAPLPAADALALLLAALGEWRELHAGLTAGPVPPDLAEEHAALAAVVGRATAAVQTAHDGLRTTAACAVACSYRSTPSWARLRADTATTAEEHGVALDDWRSAAAAAKAAVATRGLAEKPRV